MTALPKLLKTTAPLALPLGVLWVAHSAQTARRHAQMSGQFHWYGDAQGPYSNKPAQPASADKDKDTPDPHFAARWEGRMRSAYGALETIAPWRKLVVFALSTTWPRNFASVCVPRRFGRELAAQFTGQGFEARLCDGLSADTQYLTLWLVKPAETPQTTEATTEAETGEGA